MSKKITHEQARESIEMVDSSFFPTEKEALLTYIKQQKILDEYLRISYDRDIKAYSEIRKLNKLLELQDDLITELSKAEHAQSSYAIDYIKNKIKELENE